MAIKKVGNNSLKNINTYMKLLFKFEHASYSRILNKNQFT